ncbi:MAG: ABC transporter substrate-binding protein [bacterium]
MSLVIYLLSAFFQNSYANGPSQVDSKKIKRNNYYQPLHIYNWSAYFSKRALKQFEEETGITIKYETYQSNEEMYRHVKTRKNNYDLVFPSTYYISKMQKEGLLQPIDKSRLTQFQHLDPTFLNKSYDMGNKFSLPYLWGSTGIGVNAAKIDPKTINSWKDLWLPTWKDRLLLTNSPHQIFRLILTMRGYSINTTEHYRLKGAFNTLKKIKQNNPLFRSELLRYAFLNEDVDIGMMWNGEAIIAQKENPNIHYIYPNEGAIFNIDSFAIPITNNNLDASYLFIDFMLRPQIAAYSVEDLGYATPNLSAKELLDEEIRNNPIIFPPTHIIANSEFQYDRGESTDQLINHYWKKFKEDIAE